ncbi:unnamed protein product [Chondrus crispus]|uniref:Homeobox domain-containing protein n=1 Tax=Chondrus crispus TaxID=2769 RepID=R7QSF0_CHOCR|nr:unnamed protein product [Chondrus crispus]CDF41034.1 unnamed protein product [Chondrus crispus]|eukprot:XP_005711328.1 unnamed protein product [Chondrus crispus]
MGQSDITACSTDSVRNACGSQLSVRARICTDNMIQCQRPLTACRRLLIRTSFTFVSLKPSSSQTISPQPDPHHQSSSRRLPTAMAENLFPRPGHPLSIAHPTAVSLPTSSLATPSAPPSWACHPPGRPPLHRSLPPPEFPADMLTTIQSLEDRLRAHPLFHQLMAIQTRRVSPSQSVTADADGRLVLPGRRRGVDLVIYYGFPKSDEDVEYCLEDTPGLSEHNFVALKNSLMESLANVRHMAQDAVAEMETNLAQQLHFRIVPPEEVHNRLRYIVSRFSKTRKEILHKYRGYVRNRRWIENIATRQRRGCLTHRQNNILRLWLFTHFSNPYPDVHEKRQLMRETELSATQVNNWLINARSRVWKPTVDMMSGDRVKQEMSNSEGRYAAFREDADVDDPRNSFSGPRNGLQAPDGHHVDVAHGRLQAVLAQGPQGAHATHPVAEEGAWLPQQNWGNLEFPSEGNLNN